MVWKVFLTKICFPKNIFAFKVFLWNPILQFRKPYEELLPMFRWTFAHFSNVHFLFSKNLFFSQNNCLDTENAVLTTLPFFCWNSKKCLLKTRKKISLTIFFPRNTSTRQIPLRTQNETLKILPKFFARNSKLFSSGPKRNKNRS